MSSILDAALAYAARGWPVFPCDPATKEPLLPKDRDGDGKPVTGTGGVKKASTDPELIRSWWRRWPDAMIALATGPKAGFFVVDVDAGKDERSGEVFTRDQLLAELEKVCGPMPATWRVATPRGGVHLYFQYPPDVRLGNRAGFIRRIDTRGDGGYVFAPPSRRAAGKFAGAGGQYEWISAPLAEDDRPVEAPAQLLDCVLRRGAFAPVRPAVIGAQSPSQVRGAQAEEAVRRYAEIALDAEAREVAATRTGSRNQRLSIAGIKLGHLVGAGALSRGEVEQALLNAAEASGLAKDDGWHSVRQSLKSAIDKGMAEPKDLSLVRGAAAERAAGGSFPPPPSGPEDYGLAAGPPPSDDRIYNESPQETLPAGQGAAFAPAANKAALNLQLAFYPLTDLGNAERFRERNRGELLHCPELGWLWWDGRRWSRDGAEGKVRIAEHTCVRAIKDEAEALRVSGRDEIVGFKPAKKKKPKPAKLSQDEKVAVMAAALAGDAPAPGAAEPELEGDPEDYEPTAIKYSDLLDAWARDSESNNRLSKIADHAKAYLAVTTRELDSDRYAINVLNGTLHAGRRNDDGKPFIDFRPHNPADLITKLAPVEYRPKATCPRYDRFLHEVQPKLENVRCLHQWGGYSLTGDIGEQKLFFFWGKGRNGKSTLVDVWGHVAGDYGTSVPIETFLAEGRGRQGAQASPDLAMLKGVRFVRTSEPDRGSKLGEALIKLVTGGEPFPVRELHKPFYQLFPQFKLTISGNYRPKIVGTDDGIWRRMRLFPWVVQIDKDKVDQQLGAKLMRELPGVLNRLLAGLLDWMENGLIIPKDVDAATETYRTDSDPLGRFLDVCVAKSPGDKVQSSVLHGVFNAWCKANGEREWTATGFGLAMSDRGFESKKSNVTWWLNIKLVRAVSDFVDAEGRPLREGEGEKNSAEDDVVPL